MVLSNHRLGRGREVVVAMAIGWICACFEDPESTAETAEASSSGDGAAAESTSTAPADGTDEGAGSEDGNDTTDGSPTCGNGQLEGDELCDDGNEDDTDDCTTACAPPACDDGLLSGDESDVDCGGRCEPCGTTEGCVADSDCTSGNCYAGACVPECVEWQTQFGSAGNDGASDIAIDAVGDVYVTGRVAGAVDSVDAVGGSDVFVAKLAGDAGTFEYLRIVGSTEEDTGAGLAVDAQGQVIVGGYTFGAFQGQAVVGGQDIALSFFDATGNHQWSLQLGTSSADRAEQVQFGDDGRIYVGAYTTGAYPGHENGGSGDILLLKLEPDGTELWNRQIGDVGVQIGYDLDGASADAFVLGGYSQTSFEGNRPVGGSDAIVGEFDGDGTLQWSAQLGGPGDDEVVSVVVDDEGNVYGSGYTTGSFDGGALVGATDAFVFKFGPDGTHLWSTQIGSTGGETGQSVVVDAEGTVYVSGGTSGSLGGGRLQGPTDAFLVTLDPEGEVLSTRLIGTPEGDAANESVVGAGGELYLAGSTGGVLGTSSAGMGDAWVGRFCL